MKKFICVLLCLTLCFALAACENSSEPTAPASTKSLELQKQYDFYDKSVKEIINTMKVTPEQADEIFIVLVSCDLDGAIRNIYSTYGNENNYNYYWEGSASTYEVDIEDGVAVEVRYLSKILYPPERATDNVNAAAIDNATTLIEALSPESTRADYEATQNAYDSLSSSQKKEISSLFVDKLKDYNVSTMTIEQVVDFAIDNAGVEKENVMISENISTEKSDDFIVSLYLKGADNLTDNMVRDGMFIDTRDILKDLQSRTDISNVNFFWSFPLVDVYGNSKDEIVLKITLDIETIEKINFSSFDWNNFSIISDDFFIHPALA